MARILLIEDERVIAKALQRLLQRHGYDTETAATVEEARRRVLSTTYDLVVADLRLPDGLGIDILPLCGDTPALIMSSDVNLRYIRGSGMLGIVDYIDKPFEHGEMLAKISKSLAMRPAPRIASTPNRN